MQERLTEIEIKLAHLEQTVNELNEVLVKHHNLIDGLSDRCDQLTGRIKDMAEDIAGDKPGDEKPPHY